MGLRVEILVLSRIIATRILRFSNMRMLARVVKRCFPGQIGVQSHYP